MLSTLPSTSMAMNTYAFLYSLLKLDLNVSRYLCTIRKLILYRLSKSSPNLVFVRELNRISYAGLMHGPDPGGHGRQAVLEVDCPHDPPMMKAKIILCFSSVRRLPS